jgi:hypothetical protein
MATADDIRKVNNNIKAIYRRKEAALYALCLNYAAMAIQYFRAQQLSGKFWSNQTKQAMDRMFTDAFKDDKYIGWLMAHGVDYGVYLELANDGRNEAIRPVIQRYAGRFISAAQRIYKDD